MTYDKICLMVPTFGRSKDRLPTFINSAYDMAKSAICFCFCVNERDTDTIKFLTETKWPDDFEMDVIVEETVQPNLSYYFNLMYDNTKFNRPGTLVSMLGDDMIFKTQDYDHLILDEVNKNGGAGVFWCDDDFVAHGDCPVNLFVSRQFVQATRLPFMCPFYPADMIDMVWYYIGQMTGTLRYLPDIKIFHDHNMKLQERNFDRTFKRLKPFQTAANEPTLQKAGVVYANIAAGNLISSGIGSWQE